MLTNEIKLLLQEREKRQIPRILSPDYKKRNVALHGLLSNLAIIQTIKEQKEC